jgi:GNAT superfamily N-acetyltransferase
MAQRGVDVTGFEADEGPLDVAALAAMEHANFIAAIEMAVRQVEGSHVERGDGVTLLASGLPLRLFNPVLLDDDANPDAVEAAVHRMRELGARFVVNLRDGFDDRHRPGLHALGLVPIVDGPWMPGMALHPLPPVGTAPVPTGGELRRATDAAGIAAHLEAAGAGFGMPAEWLRAIVTTQLLDDPAATIYVGMEGGVAVASGLGVRTGSTIGVYNIATIESARNRGWGRAMTMRIVDDGAAAGCDVAILQASEMGRPIYERLGFKNVLDYLGFIDPPEPTS